MRPEGKYKNNINLLLLSRYSAKTFHWERLWKAVQPSAKHFYSVQQMALMLLTVAIFFLLCDFFSAGAGCSFVLSTCRAPPNKTSGGAECGRGFFLAGGGGTGTWRLVCVSSKAAFTACRMRTKTCCRISLSLTWVTFAFSGKQNWPLQWLTLMQQFAFGNFIPPTAILNEERGRRTRENNGNVPLFSRWLDYSSTSTLPTGKAFYTSCFRCLWAACGEDFSTNLS